jgi:translation initiation factor 2B subunit (eIF-2B alpha/beta/delta family)
MAPLFNLFNSLLLELDGCTGRRDSQAILSERAQAFAGAMYDRNRAIARHVCSIIAEGATVFTHSDSSTLRAALQHSHEAGRKFNVVCTESRPACEGSRLAQALSTAGVSTWLVTDSLIFSLLRERRAGSMVLVGADAVTTGGVINKAGTSGLAVAAQRWGVPFHVLAGSEKFLPSKFAPRGAIQDKPPEEILRSPPKELRIINRYFDVTPLDSITAVISESGAIPPGNLARELEHLPLHPELLAALR